MALTSRLSPCSPPLQRRGPSPAGGRDLNAPRNQGAWVPHVSRAKRGDFRPRFLHPSTREAIADFTARGMQPIDEDAKIQAALSEKPTMLLAGRTRESFLTPARSRIPPPSRMYVKTRHIIPFRITTFRCSGSPLKTGHFNPRILIFMRTLLPSTKRNPLIVKDLRTLLQNTGGGGTPSKTTLPNCPPSKYLAVALIPNPVPALAPARRGGGTAVRDLLFMIDPNKRLSGPIRLTQAVGIK